MLASIPERYRNEQVFIREIWFNATDVSTRLIYADWLEEHRDPRAEILRNDVQLVALYGRDDDESNHLRESLSRRRERLIRFEHRDWVSLIGCCLIDTCVACSRVAADRTEFRIRCPMRWDNLQPIGDEAHIRYCTECERQVVYCWDTREARKWASRGSCVAIDPSISQRYDDYEPDHFDNTAEIGELL